MESQRNSKHYDIQITSNRRKVHHQKPQLHKSGGQFRHHHRLGRRTKAMVPAAQKCLFHVFARHRSLSSMTFPEQLKTARALISRGNCAIAKSKNPSSPSKAKMGQVEAVNYSNAALEQRRKGTNPAKMGKTTFFTR